MKLGGVVEGGGGVGGVLNPCASISGLLTPVATCIGTGLDEERGLGRNLLLARLSSVPRFNVGISMVCLLFRLLLGLAFWVSPTQPAHAPFEVRLPRLPFIEVEPRPFP